MKGVDKRFALIADNGDRLYPYKKQQRSTNRYGFALTAPGEQDRNGGGTYTIDINLVVKKLVFENWSARVKTIDKEDKQREGTLGIGKRTIVGYELDGSLQHLIHGALVPPVKITSKPVQEKSLDNLPRKISAEKESAIDEYTLKAIKTRRGQPVFRKSLLIAFSSKCCISHCAIESVLEAAHIIPHVEESNYKVTNGLLLRADLHTLFDLNLLGIDRECIVHISDSLRSSEYAEYEGCSIGKSLPEETRKKLAARFRRFTEICHS
jgi:hypothetical protein